MKQITLAALVAATILNQGCVSPQSFPINIDGAKGEYKINDQGDGKVCGVFLPDLYIIDADCDNHADARVNLQNTYDRFSYLIRSEFNAQQRVSYDSLLETAQRQALR